MIIVILCYVISLICCLGLGYFLVKNIRKNNAISKAATRIAKESSQSFYERKKAEEERYIREGNIDEKSFLYKLDLIISKSGIQRKISFINTEIFILLVVIMMAIAIAVVTYITRNGFYGVITGTLVLFLVVCIMFYLVSRNEKILDENVLQFADMLEGYSAVSDDIVDIFERCAEYLDEPLKSAIKHCVAESRIDGNIKLALQRMRIRLGHRKLNEMLVNIEECSLNNADYRAVITRLKNSIGIYISEREERSKMARDAKVNMLIMLGVLVISMYVMQSFVEENIITFLMARTAGEFILYGVFVVVLITFWKLITLGKK